MNVEQLAAAKRLSVAWLRENAMLEDEPGGGVRIPYLGESGEFLFCRRRDVPGRRFDQPAGVPLSLYGLWRLADRDGSAELTLAEGESDVWALWSIGEVVLGMPGVGAAKAIEAEHLVGIERLYVVPDNDPAGEQMVEGVIRRLTELRYAGRLLRVCLDGVKDVGELYARAPASFKEAWRLLRAAAEQIPLPVPEPADEDRLVATIHDLARVGAQIRWLWPGWIPQGVLTALAGEGGCGKTRFCADLLRRIRTGECWPDGQPMTLPRDTLALWVMADNHHDEMVTLATDFGIEDSVRINAWADDPYGGVALEEAGDIGDLEKRIRKVEPALVIVDTVGNSTDKNLSRQEDAKAFYQPLQVLARRYRTAVVCVTHLNATGKFLGRRVLEKVRCAIRMHKPDPSDPRRAVEVYKTNSKKPDALGMTMKDSGNEYDQSPPVAPEESAPSPERVGRNGRPPAKLDECREWLRGQFAGGPRRVSEVISASDAAGFARSTLYAAKDTIGVEEAVTQGRKWWSLAPTNPFTDE